MNIEDAPGIRNGIEIFGADAQRCHANRHSPKGACVFYDCWCKSLAGPMHLGHCGIGLGGGKVIHAWD